MREGLPVILGTAAQQQDVHDTLAPQAQSPHQVVGSARVVAHEARRAARDDRTGVFTQIALEAPAREQSRVLAVVGDQHEGARLAIRRAGDLHQHAQRQRVAAGAFTLEQRQQRPKGSFHGVPLCQRTAPARTRRLRLAGPGCCAAGGAGALITRMVNKVAGAATATARPPPHSLPRKRRGRGRPKGGAAGRVRERLLSAARELFLRYGYRAVSSRQIGAAAGVNFAMIRYYFGGKPGLYREILQGVLPPQIAGLEAMDSGCPELKPADVLSNITRLWAANPWIAGFVLREVLVPGGPMRAMFLREFPERLAPLVERAVRAEMARGALRSDLDPQARGAVAGESGGVSIPRVRAHQPRVWGAQ